MSKSAPIQTAGAASPALEELIDESISKAVPTILAKFISSGGLVSPPAQSTQPVSLDTSGSAAEEAPGPSGRGERFFAAKEEVELSSELLDLTTKAFSKALTKDKWKELSDTYPPIKGSDTFLRVPTMEADMKEEIKKSHGFRKTKEVFAFDDGLAEQQGPFTAVAGQSSRRCRC